jgi:hypothetical protein
MQRLVLDSTLGRQLAQAEDQVEFCDQTGHTIGYFLPATEPTPELLAWAKSQITEEELERRSAEPGGRTTAEVLRRLSEK